MTHIFERPLPSGWVYPCTADDIARRLEDLPPGDLGGLWAVGLVPATRKDCSANGRYFAEPKPTIHIYSHAESLAYRQPPHVKRSDIERTMAIDLEFGMRIRQEGTRWWCEWDAEPLRCFIVEFVLLHEVGHHVYRMQRHRQGLDDSPNVRAREQYADDYAYRHLRR